MPRSSAESGDADAFKLSNSPSLLLRRAEQLASERFAQLVGDAITLRQFFILAAIAEAPGLSQTDLGRIVGMDRSTLGDTMARMENRSWIVRTPSASDGRAYSVVLGSTGATMLSATFQHARAADAAILDLLPKTKGRIFLNTLSKLSRLADAAAAKAEREQKKQAKRKAREKAAERSKNTRKQRG